MKKGTFLLNAGSNMAGFALNVLVGFWFTPYLIRHLGTATYGLVPLSITIVGYFGIINAALNNAVSRFLTVALEQKDHEQSNKVFNSSLFGTLGILLLLLPLGVAASLGADRLIRVPPGQEMAARQLFGLTLAALFLNTVVTPFGVSSFSRNRFDLRNLIGIVQNLFRVGIVVALFSFGAPALWHVGIGVFGATVIFAIGSIWIWKKLTPMLVVSRRAVSGPMLRNLTATGGWVLLTQIATVLLLGIDLLVVNRLFGPTESGQYATALQWSGLLRTLAITFISTFAPTIIAFHARGEITAMLHYTQRSMRVIGITMAIPIGLICAFSPQLLELWVGPEFIGMSTIQRILVAHLCINLVTIPLYSVNLAANKVRVPAYADMLAGVVNLILALVLARPGLMGIAGVAVAGALTLTFKNVVFLPLYTARNIGENAWVFLRHLLPGVAGTAMVTILGLAAANCFPISSLLVLGLVSALVGAIYLPMAYFMLLRKTDRGLLAERLQPLLKFIRPPASSP